MIKPWKKLQSHVIASAFGKFFEITTFLDPQGAERQYSAYGQQNFAVILPITKTGEVVAIRQYYQGCDKILWTLPGGNIDPQELFLATVLRELLEETGFHCPQIVQLSRAVWINTRNSPSHYFCFLGLGCDKVAEPKLDKTEDIEVKLIPLSEWINLSETEIEDPCAVVTTHRALPHLRERGFL